MAAPSSDLSPRQLRIAVEGCGHGTLNAIYASIETSCKLKKWPGIDLLIILGDFQSVRNPHDLNCMSVPVKYREIGDFHEYYSGKRTAPYLTVFIAGNHEASNYLHELYYGGWAAPNIYYMGAANVLAIGGVRIAGLSGIWKGYDYRKAHFERIPYNDGEVKTAYHVREIDVRKLLQIRGQVDVGLSHDWPNGVEWKGNYKSLFSKKTHFREDAESGRLGSVAARYVLDRLRPPHWFSAHLHIKYPAVIHHKDPDHTANGGSNASNGTAKIFAQHAPAPPKNDEEIELDLDMDDNAPTPAPRNTDEIALELDEEEVDGTSSALPSASNDDVGGAPQPSGTIGVSDELRAQLPAAFSKPSRPDPPVTLSFPAEIANTSTNFLALDKCLPHRDFLQLMEVPRPASAASQDGEPLRLEYDAEWLAITRAVHTAHPDYVTLGNEQQRPPQDLGDAAYAPHIAAAREWIEEHVVKPGKWTVPLDFVQTAPPYLPGPGEENAWRNVRDQPREYANPQTQAFCDLIGIENVFAISDEEAEANLARGPKVNGSFSGGDRGRGRGGGRGRGRGRGFDRGGGRGRGGRGGRGGHWR